MLLGIEIYHMFLRNWQTIIYYQSIVLFSLFSQKQASSSSTTLPNKVSKENGSNGSSGSNDGDKDDDSAKENQELSKNNSVPQVRKKGIYIFYVFIILIYSI